MLGRHVGRAAKAFYLDNGIRYKGVNEEVDSFAADLFVAPLLLILHILISSIVYVPAKLIFTFLLGAFDPGYFIFGWLVTVIMICVWIANSGDVVQEHFPIERITFANLNFFERAIYAITKVFSFNFIYQSRWRQTLHSSYGIIAIAWYAYYTFFWVSL